MWIRLFDKDYRREDVSKKRIPDIVAYYRIHNQAMHHKRSRKPEVQKRLAKQLEEAYQNRKGNINKNNTLFLKK